MTTNKKPITYTKLRSGDWGIRGCAGDILEGMPVEVTKRSGESKQEVVGRIIWTGEDKRSGENISIAEVQQQRTHGTRAYSGYSGDYCGYPCPVEGFICSSANGPCHDCL